MPDSHKYISESEVKSLMSACNKVFKRYQHRNKTLILITFRHGLRSTEACNLQWSDIRLNDARVFVRRSKNGISIEHPMEGDEIRALRKLWRDYSDRNSQYVFVSSQGNPIDTSNFRWIMGRLRKYTGIQATPHTLRHACGYALVNKGLDTRLIQDYLGHRKLENTVIYTQLNPERFKEIEW